MDRLKLLTGILAMLILSSCGRYKDIDVGDVQDFSIQGFEENALVLAVKVPVHNPSMHKVTITGFDARVFINDQYIGKINSFEPVILPRKSNEVYDLVFHVRLANFLGTAMKMMNLKRGSKINLRLEGSFMAKSAGVKKKVEINEARNVVI